MPIPSDVAFTPAVKAIQEQRGSRKMYARMEQGAGWETSITSELEAFVADQISFFMATTNAEGQPYIQHRGGPPGFLRVLDEHTLAFADFSGNRQYISLGNLGENPKVHLFLIDYATKRRIKIWGEATVVEDDAELLDRLAQPATPGDAPYKARPEQVILIRVTAWDVNCPQHIPQRFEAADVAKALAVRDAKIAALEAEIASIREA